MRLARLRHDIDLFAGYETYIAPKGTIVQVHDNPPSPYLYCCNIPGYSRVRHVAIRYLEFLDESN